MKQILCYGDSNTWGLKRDTFSRFPYEVRWTGLLAQMLGEQFRVIEEGLCGRTIAVEDELQPFRSGLNYVEPCLMSHFPLDHIVVMLGTNDLKCRYNLSPGEIGMSMEEMIKRIKNCLYWFHSDAKILLVAPAPLISCGYEDCELDDTSIEKSRVISRVYREIAARYQLEFLDAAEYITGFQEDGCHFSEEGHRQFSRAVFEKLNDSYNIQRTI